MLENLTIEQKFLQSIGKKLMPSMVDGRDVLQFLEAYEIQRNIDVLHAAEFGYKMAWMDRSVAHDSLQGVTRQELSNTYNQHLQHMMASLPIVMPNYTKSG